VARHDAALLVVLGGVAGELEDLREEKTRRSVEHIEFRKPERGSIRESGMWWLRTSAARYSRTAAR
jgi:hypothetical protein